MNYLKKLFYIFFTFFCLSSCKNEAVNFNNDLVNIQKSVLEKVKDFGKEMPGEDSSSAMNIQPQVEKIVLFIDDKIKEAQKIKAPAGGEELKNAIVTQLQFEKDIVEKIGRLTQPEIPKEERSQIETELLTSQHKASSLEDSIRSAQEIFAKRHKFKLE